MYLLLYSNITLTIGAKRSLISDLQNGKVHLIPNSFAIFINENNKKDKKEIYNTYSKEEVPIVNEYFQWLEKKEFISWIENQELLDCFVELPKQWDMPYKITNMILDIGITPITLDKVFEEIETHKVPFLQIRFYKNISITELSNILYKLKESCINGLEIILPYSDLFTEEVIIEIISNQTRIFEIVFYNAPTNKTVNNLLEHLYLNSKIVYTIEDISSCKYCGIISQNHFVANIDLYMEGQFHNTCLNRKISVDENGDIKNCPSMLKNFGNINNTSFNEVLLNNEFINTWNITKSDITICKECEFRNICTDCRAYIQNPNDIFSKPLKCGYDPYSNEWEEWSKNPLNKIGIEFYELENHLPS